MIFKNNALRLRVSLILVIIVTLSVLSISCKKNQELPDGDQTENYEKLDSSNINNDNENTTSEQINDDADEDISNQSSISEESMGATQSNLRTILIYTVLSVIIIGLLFLSVYLYRWRLLTLGDNAALVPEKWGKYLEQVGDAYESVNKTVKTDLKALKLETRNNTEKLESMIETYITLQDALDKKDKEINRLKSGYDLVVFKKFLKRFIRVDQTIDEVLELDEIEKSDVVMIKRLLEDAFFECGLEKFEPNIGDNYLEIEGVEEDPENLLCDQQEKEYQIAEIKSAGYHLKTLEGNEVIKPAKVKIYTNN